MTCAPGYWPATLAEANATKGPTPGLLAIYNGLLGAFHQPATTDPSSPASKVSALLGDGTYNRRPIRGTTNVLSVHAVGRAGDLVPSTQIVGDLVVAKLWSLSLQLGIQLILWDGWEYEPCADRKRYTGPSALEYTNKLFHFETTPDAARGPFNGSPAGLTPTMFETIWNGK